MAWYGGEPVRFAVDTTDVAGGGFRVVRGKGSW